MKVLIYGAGQTGEQIFRNICSKCEVVGFLDGNPDKKGMMIEGVQVLGDVETLHGLVYDQIYIGTIFWKAVKKKLLDSGVPEDRIVIDIPEDLGSPVRNTWLEYYAKLHSKEKFAVAEGGVYRGEFAAVINRCFPNSKLYLFDTFEGFDERDILIEKNKHYSDSEVHSFGNTSVDFVMSKMAYPDMVEVHKGYFPESAHKVEDTFMFVNLDFDLYQPILEGLRFFYPRMVRGTVLLVHDYYHAGLLGVREAIKDYEREVGKEIMKLPIGDNQSIALVKD